jgi:hypothetical protein
MRRRPTPPPWKLGSTVIGPTARIGSPSARKLDPTTRPSSLSATTPNAAGEAIKAAASCVPASAEGKSGGKACAAAMPRKAS